MPYGSVWRASVLGQMASFQSWHCCEWAVSSAPFCPWLPPPLRCQNLKLLLVTVLSKLAIQRVQRDSKPEFQFRDKYWIGIQVWYPHTTLDCQFKQYSISEISKRNQNPVVQCGDKSKHTPFMTIGGLLWNCLNQLSAFCLSSVWVQNVHNVSSLCNDFLTSKLFSKRNCEWSKVLIFLSWSDLN